jgi:uncharacterized protein YbbK (DUF523 family)
MLLASAQGLEAQRRRDSLPFSGRLPRAIGFHPNAFSLVRRAFLRYNNAGPKGGYAMNILVSACLMGACCRYDAEPAPDPRVLALAARHALIPVCPEIYGGLPIPRQPCELRGGRVVGRDGEDFTGAFERGAREALKLARASGCRYAVLKERSPSCGVGRIYDGSFSGRLIPGDGVTAALLRRNGVVVLTPEQADRCVELKGLNGGKA